MSAAVCLFDEAWRLARAAVPDRPPVGYRRSSCIRLLVPISPLTGMRADQESTVKHERVACNANVLMFG